MARRFYAFAVALSLVAVTGGPARADGTAAASETARALFNEGLALRARGDLEGAIDKLRAAHALRATPVTAFELARAYVEHRDLVEARDLLLSIKRLPVGAAESRGAQDARRDAAKLADELKARIPTLTVALTGPGAGHEPVVLVDDVAIPREALAEPQRLDPKRHHVVARAAGAREATTDVELKEGESARVVLDLPAADPTPAPPPPSASLHPAAEAPPTTLPKVLVYGGLALGFAGLVVGTYAGLRAIDQVSELKGACSGDRICTPSEASAISSAKTSGDVATVGFLAAGVGAALALTGLWLWPRSPSAGATSAALVVGPGTLGVRGAFP